jgi:hypothetical protein
MARMIKRVCFGAAFVVLAAIVILALLTSIAGGVSEVAQMRPTPINKAVVVLSGLGALGLVMIVFRWQDRIRGL